LGRCLDLRDCLAQRRRYVFVRLFVEADMTVADLNESEAVFLTSLAPHRAASRLLDRHALEYAPGQRPHRARADPCHAVQEVATVPFRLVVLLLCHVLSFI